MSSLAEDITAAKAAIHSMSHDLPLVAEQMAAKLGNIQDKLARLISSSQDYGKLKVSSLILSPLYLIGFNFSMKRICPSSWKSS